MELDPKIVDKIKQLEAKFGASGQDLGAYLDGLLYSDYLTYWDYIQLETLLSLQRPCTKFPDEKVFIIYHQITELNFKLIIHELDEISKKETLSPQQFKKRLQRIVRYFESLVYSYEIMLDGMDKEEFMKFRLALMPASGFQSVQYRRIEISSTELINLVNIEERAKMYPEKDVRTLYDHLYWKSGAIDSSTGKPTLTLLQFEKKYKNRLIELAQLKRNRNIGTIAKKMLEEEYSEEIEHLLRRYDLLVNVEWPLSHYKSAVKYLSRPNGSAKATGGTNWQEYLPPKFQKRCFFPWLWSNEEIENWGKSWVSKNVMLQE